MSRRLRLFGACALVFVFCSSGHARIRRRSAIWPARRKKTKAALRPKKSLPMKTFPPVRLRLLPLLFRVSHKVRSPPHPRIRPRRRSVSPSSSEQLAKLESTLNQLGALDRATLVKNALEGANPDFPGHVEWEARLLTARQAFVLQGHAQIEKMKQIQSMAQSLNGSHDPNDPRVKDLTDRAKQVMQEAVRTGAAFQAVVLEGRDLAAHSASQ